MLKIVGGKYGSRSILAPKGKDTRPTTNRVREALFSALCCQYGNDMTLSGARVLDLFSGSGALSFEALSRGAEFVLANEKNRQSFSTILKNIEILKLDKHEMNCLCMDSFSPKFLERVKNDSPFDIVLCDPPYRFDKQPIEELIETMREEKILKGSALVYYEHSSIETLSIDDCLYKSDFGDIKCEIFRI